MSVRRLRRGAAWLLAVALAPWIAADALAGVRPGAEAFDALFAQVDALPRMHGDHAELRPQYDRLRAVLPPGDEARALQLAALQCGLGLFGDAARVVSEADAGLAKAERLGDTESQVRLLYCRGDALEAQRDERAAVAAYSRGIELARQAGLPRLLGEGLELRAGTVSILGEHAAALLDLMQAQRVYEQARLTDLAEGNVLGLAVAYRRMGEYAQALAYLRRSEEAGRRQQDWQVVYTSLLQQGYLHFDRDDAAASLVPLSQALALAERKQFPRDTAIARVALAASHVQIGKPERALQLLSQARATLDALGDRSSLDTLLSLRRGEALAALGRHREALQQYARVDAALAGSDNLRYRIMLHRARAPSFEALGQPREALAEYRQWLRMQTQLDRVNRGQRETLMRHQFELGRRDAEYRRLAADKAVNAARLQAELRLRRWQRAALAGSLVLLLVLAALGLGQRRSGRRLHALAMTDPLTGAANRRSLERFAALAIAEADPRTRPVSVIALDVDHFKRINDRYGHAAGDAVLRRVAEACQCEMRKCDLLGRTGGEEFVAVLPGTALPAARRVADRLLAAVGALELDPVAPGLTISVSIGVAEYTMTDGDFRSLLHRADAALYRAKQSGRNRVECDDGSRDARTAGDRCDGAGSGCASALAATGQAGG
ncbi:diguanylate cyclase [Lysobacter korlensis]|uniref:diguanylate cyclase n=1 Tax=Lysobacter korlensis TaxID=553636 RepID=A0ABV6RGY8_9GAMM